MDRLTIFYDGRCPVCVRTADVLREHETHVPLVLVDATSAEARARCRGLNALGAELVVASDDGRAWIGPAAFLVTGWTLRGWRGVVEWIVGTPWALGAALSFFGWVSANRDRVGDLLGLPACAHGECGMPAALGPYR